MSEALKDVLELAKEKKRMTLLDRESGEGEPMAWQWDWREGLKYQVRGGGEPWRPLSGGGSQSDMEASDQARQAGSATWEP